jgi:DNA repair protein RecN (Recombination protein N)
MLLELAVADLALLERVRLPLGPGLTVLTGETGAGKSLLIDALLLVTGGRADGTLLRTGAASARIEALFDRLPEPLIAVRELAPGGRSIARLDDETVTVGRLGATVGPLVEIHGQHEQHRLLAGAVQRDLLAAFGGLGDDRAACAEAVGAWRAALVALEALPADAESIARRMELARWAIDESPV